MSGQFSLLMILHPKIMVTLHLEKVLTTRKVLAAKAADLAAERNTGRADNIVSL